MKNPLITCPNCYQAKDNIKRYRLTDTLIFLVLAAHSTYETYTCCSSCMRKKIIRKTFNHNIITAWILWIILIVPMNGILYLMTYTSGHSKAIKKLIRQQQGY